MTVDPQLKLRLKAWTWHDIWAWPRVDPSPLVEVAECGEEGAELLAEEFQLRENLRERAAIAGALGIATGSAGIEELRQAVKTTGPGTSELRVSALVSLTRRIHEDATSDLVEALSDRVNYVREIAMDGLSAYGTSDAWEPAFSLLPKWLKKNPKPKLGPFPAGLWFLQIRADADRMVKLDQLLAGYRGRMDRLGNEAVDRLCPPLGDYMLVDLPELLKVRQSAARSRFIECGGREIFGLVE
jgi:HEAT repeat protein